MYRTRPEPAPSTHSYPRPLDRSKNGCADGTTEKLKSELTQLYDTAPMSAKDKGHKKFNAKLQRHIKKMEKDFAPGAACLNGFSFMARASTLGGSLKFNDRQPDKLDQGIQADMVITEPGGSSTAGIAYTIRFLKVYFLHDCKSNKHLSNCDVSSGIPL